MKVKCEVCKKDIGEVDGNFVWISGYLCNECTNKAAQARSYEDKNCEKKSLTTEEIYRLAAKIQQRMYPEWDEEAIDEIFKELQQRQDNGEDISKL